MAFTVDDLHRLAFPEEPVCKKSLEDLAVILSRLAYQAKSKAEALTSHSSSLSAREETQKDIIQEIIPATKTAKKANKAFDIHNYKHRFIALEIAYIGWKYSGSTYQPKEPNTIEGILLRALKRTRLIAHDATLESLCLSRSGRTDKGVSGLSQVVALTVRSNARVFKESLPQQKECNYPETLNRALPSDIRVLGWTDVPECFSARFSANWREYRYFLVWRGGGLQLSAMQAAAAHFVGEHDFRNFCKADAEHVNHFVRHILDFRIEPLPHLTAAGASVLQVHIRGSAFLWHQVRCMVAVLELVGKRLEEPEVVQQLLDIEQFGSKPQYKMADEEPLLFHACSYNSLVFQRSASSLQASQQILKSNLDKHLQKIALLITILEKLNVLIRETDTTEAQSCKAPHHIKLAERSREPTLAEKFAKFGRALTNPQKL